MAACWCNKEKMYLPPPFLETIHGNLHTLPRPTANPNRESTDSASFDQNPRAGSSIDDPSPTPSLK